MNMNNHIMSAEKARTLLNKEVEAHDKKMLAKREEEAKTLLERAEKELVGTLMSINKRILEIIQSRGCSIFLEIGEPTLRQLVVESLRKAGYCVVLTGVYREYLNVSW
jgi:hypothetical protein